MPASVKNIARQDGIKLRMTGHLYKPKPQHLSVNHIMTRSILWLLTIALIISCSNQSEKKSIKQNNDQDNSITNLNDLNLPNTEWFKYYSKKIKDFNIEKFQFVKKWNESGLLSGNILGDFDSSFNKLYAQFLINSPDNSKYIDLDSYEFVFEENEKSEIICEGAEVDQEVNLVNRATKEIKRLAFHGTISRTEDAEWISNSKIILLGVQENKLTIEIIDLEKLGFEFYLYPEIISGEPKYTEEIKLKRVKFN